MHTCHLLEAIGHPRAIRLPSETNTGDLERSTARKSLRTTDLVRDRKGIWQKSAAAQHQNSQARCANATPRPSRKYYESEGPVSRPSSSVRRPHAAGASHHASTQSLSSSKRSTFRDFFASAPHPAPSERPPVKLSVPAKLCAPKRCCLT